MSEPQITRITLISLIRKESKSVGSIDPRASVFQTMEEMRRRLITTADYTDYADDEDDAN